MSEHYRYAPRALAAAYGRSAVGLVATIGTVTVLDPASWLSAVLLGAATLFLAYAARTLVRHVSVIEIDAAGLRSHGPFGADVPWSELRSVELDYYTTRADRSNGWMQLVVRGSRARVRIDSTLQGFTSIVSAAAGEAARRQRALDERTRTHLDRLGIAFDRGVRSDLGPVAGARHA